MLLRPLPYPESDRLMAIWEVNHRGGWSRLADPNFTDFRNRNRTFKAMAKFRPTPRRSWAPKPVRATVATVSKDFFTVLGFPPCAAVVSRRTMHGSAEPVAIVSHRYWTQSMGSADTFSNVHLRVEDRVHTVVGSCRRAFVSNEPDLWRPAELDADNTSRTSHNYQGIGRLADHVSVAQAAADISHLAKDIVRTSSEQGDYLMTDAAVAPLQTSLTRRVGSTLSTSFSEP